MKNIDTLCIQAGYSPKSGEPRIVPIVQSTTFAYDTADELASLFDLKADGFFYSRLANPTVDALEKKVAALEGGTLAVGLAAGQTANMLTVLNVAGAGDNILCAQTVYGGTYNLFGVTLKKLGIETRFYNVDDDEKTIEGLIDDKTRLIFAETIANPAIVVLDFDKIARIAKKHKVLFAVDNTLATAVLCRPFELGANIVIYSSTKYMDGHATSLGGIVVDGGNFDYRASGRYPEFCVPDESYHGLVYADLNGASFAIKMRAQLVRDTGAIMSPVNAFLTNLGAETLALRMERHCANAAKVAKFLSENDKIEWINHPSLPTNKYYALAQKYLPSGQGGMMSFGVKQTAKDACRFMENLKLTRIVTHVADIRTCVLHPASTTHRQLSDDALTAAGIPQNLIRLSVGCENADDILTDLDNALKKV